MRRDQILYLLIIVLLIFAVLITGCTQAPAPAQPTRNLPTTAHAEKTPAPVVTTEMVEETPVPVSTVTELPEVQVTETSPVQPGLIPFSGDGISLKYPERFKPISEQSLEQMRTVAKKSGIDILTILAASDSKDSVQVTKQSADATIEGMYNEKMVIAREIAVNGSATIMGMTFVQYAAEKEKLSDGTGVVKVYAENSDKGTAVTYLICRPGTVYNVNFIYDSPERADEQADARTPVLQSIQLS